MARNWGTNRPVKFIMSSVLIILRAMPIWLPYGLKQASKGTTISCLMVVQALFEHRNGQKALKGLAADDKAI